MYDLGRNKDCMDCYEHGWLVQSELNYECHAGMAGYHFLFCHISSEGRDLIYSDSCFNNCSNCFGCVGLKHKQFCIFNKQYTEEEYNALVPKIIEQMRPTGEWGEFIDSRYSPFAYNESVALEYFPLPKEEVLARGLRWKDPDPKQHLPATYTDDILTCVTCSKNYRLIPQELEFYRSMGLAIPQECHDCRHSKRMKLRNSRKLWNRQCQNCDKPIQTTYSPDRPEIVYCQECYLAAVY